MERRASRLKRWLTSGAAAGAYALGALFVVDLVGAQIAFMGFKGDDDAYRVILHRYGPRVVGGQLLVLATFLVAGAAFGSIGAVVGRFWDRALARPSSLRRQMLRGATAALLAHAWLLARSVHHYPQIYTEAFFDRGGVSRAMTRAITRLHPAVLDGTFLVIALALCFAPLIAVRARTKARELLGRTAWVPARPALGLIAASVAVLLVVSALGPTRRTRATDARPNILVLAVDSLRVDRAFAENARERFPAIANLVSRGVRFREAYVTVARTFPSFVTLLTGRWPHHHGIRHMFPSAEQRRAIGPTLPDALRKAGYRTAVVSDYAGEIFSRTPLGFDEIEVPHFDMKTIVAQRGLQVHPHVLPYATSAIGRWLFPAVEAFPENADPDRLASRAIGMLDRIAAQPFFLTVFFSAAHFPYAAPYPFYRKLTDPDYDGPFVFQKPPLSSAAVTPRDAVQIRALYDGAVMATDAAIARILAELENRVLSRRTIIVLLSDHGENLYDTDGRGMGHGDHLLGSSADHIPLVIVDPMRAQRPHDVPGIVRDVDLSPTLARLAGVAAPPTDGVDLQPLLDDRQISLNLAAFAETEFWFTAEGPGFGADERLPYPGITGVTDLAADDDIFLKPEWQEMITVAKHRAIRTERWKLVYQPLRAGVKWLLFDRIADPDETKDLANVHPEVADTLRQRLIDWLISDGRTVIRAGFAVPR